MCPFCSITNNDFLDKVADLSISSLYLKKDQTYKGYCVLIFNVRHATVPGQLSASEWANFSSDLYIAQNAVMKITGAPHMNVAALGNVIDHLHWHIIPRHPYDERANLPIWTSDLKDMIKLRLPQDEYATLLNDLQGEFQ